MQLPPLPLVDDTLFIDNSGWIENLSTCTRKLEYQCLSLRVHGAEKPALNFGSAIHLALELRYARYANKPPDQVYYEDLSVLLTDFFKDKPVPAGEWRTLNWAMDTMRRYNERYYDEEFNLLQYKDPIVCPQCKGKGKSKYSDKERDCLFCVGTGKRSLMVEMPFAIKLYTHTSGIMSTNIPRSIHVYYSGRVDLPVNYGGIGIFTMDAKTTGQLGDTFWIEQRMSNQHRGYCWAFHNITGSIPAGYVVNAIRSKEPPIYVLNNEVSKRGKKQSPEQWWQESLCRERKIITSFDLDYWKNNTIDLCEEFFWHYERGYMPMKTKWCNSYGHCPYYDTCALPPDERNGFLNSGLYTANVWSPLHSPTQSMQ